MIIEFTYNQNKICNGCKWLKLKDDWYGKCECPHNKVKERNRHVTDHKCSWKNADKHIR
jgi:hypothetical protein